MSGRILNQPPIAVDYWKLRDCSHVRLFFLSHMHSDHTVGLTPSWSQPIYCSPVTRKLLIDKYKLNPDQVYGLELNESHCLPLFEENDETICVSLLDANHCPGAVMFLFEGYFGRILYTGDFRYSLSLTYEESFNRVFTAGIDELFLDNTFCSPKCEFPSREKAMAEMLRIMLDHPDHRIMIGLRTLGKESLLVAIAKQLKTQVWVSEKRYHLLELLEMPNVFTKVESHARIHVVDQEQIKSNQMTAWNLEVPTIAIIPTALYFAVSLDRKFCHNSIFIIPYSDHSSYSELCDFVSAVAPKDVFPILTNINDRLGRSIPERMDMSCFSKYLDKSPRAPVCLPSVELALPRRNVDTKLLVKHNQKPSNSKVVMAAKRVYKYRKIVQSKGVVYEQSCEDEQHKEEMVNTKEDAHGKVNTGKSPEQETKIFSVGLGKEIQSKLEMDERQKQGNNSPMEVIQEDAENMAGPENSFVNDFNEGYCLKNVSELISCRIPSNNSEHILKCVESFSDKMSKFHENSTVSNTSVAMSLAVQLPVIDSISELCQVTYKHFTCPKYNKENWLNKLNLSNIDHLIFQSLEPIFAEEAQIMFQAFKKKTVHQFSF